MTSIGEVQEAKERQMQLIEERDQIMRMGVGAREVRMREATK